MNIKLSPSEYQATSTLFDYLIKTGLDMSNFQPIQRYIGNYVVEMTKNTRNSLEIIKNSTGTKEGSLLSVVDKTVTPIGGRLMANRLSSPITVKDEINDRLNVFKYYYYVLIGC